MPLAIRSVLMQKVLRRLGASPAKFLLSVCVLLSASYAQTPQYTEGLPTVGSAPGTLPSTAAASQMSIDATQFFVSGSDMCAAIASACLKLAATGYPFGATIDARGFTGNKVCKAINITTMLTNCAGDGSGKLLLGAVNLYADGPSGNYSYPISGSGPGTPAIVIPTGFWESKGSAEGRSLPPACLL